MIQKLILMFAVYLLIINLFGFFLMGLDKKKAKRGAWRIPELHLFLVAFFGGAFGTVLGMYVFRHKTRHWYFVVGMPLILVLHIALWAYIFFFSPITIKIM